MLECLWFCCFSCFVFVLVSVNAVTLIYNINTAGATMDSVDYNKVPITEKPLHVPPLEEVVEVLSRGLPSNFQHVSVSVVECPDLTQPPYNLTSTGIQGNPKLLEVGGVPYLMPLVQRDKLYDLAALAQHLGRDPAYLCGAGAGPWPHIAVNCEGIINLTVRNGSVEQGSRIMSVEPVGAPKGQSGFLQRRLPNTETRTAVLGNYLLSDGKPGKVIKIIVKKRVGQSNFITSIRESLKNHYGDKVVGLGGVFVLKEGKVKMHVMPDFSCTPIESDAQSDAWLHYFEMSAPLTHVGTLVTGDLDLDLRVQHFHGWGGHGEGGHYHHDTTPDTATYEAYFAVAGAVVRVDRPTNTHGFGRD